MKIASLALLCLAILGCGGDATSVSDTQSVIGKWMQDFGDRGITPPPAPPVVEFRADGTYTQWFAESHFDSTYEFKNGMLTVEGGVGVELKKQFIPQNDNAGTLRLIETGPPPANTYFWRSVN